MKTCFSCGKLRSADELGQCLGCGTESCGVSGCLGLCVCDMELTVNSAEPLLKLAPPLREHADDFTDDCTEHFTLEELAMFSCLLAKRAQYRRSPEKRAKDVQDSQNYSLLMQARIEDMKQGCEA